jgi:hypothetical protein
LIYAHDALAVCSFVCLFVQMHFRHEKETEQLKQLQADKLNSLERKFATDRAALPKRQKSAASTRKKELKRSTSKIERAQKLEEFETLEKTRMTAEETVLNQT